jgi:hypothetical protein
MRAVLRVDKSALLGILIPSANNDETLQENTMTAVARLCVQTHALEREKAKKRGHREFSKV